MIQSSINTNQIPGVAKGLRLFPSRNTVEASFFAKHAPFPTLPEGFGFILNIKTQKTALI
jgi:hypothetical protein